MKSFAEEILEGIPVKLPAEKPINPAINHAPKRKAILNRAEKKLALKNALRYFPKDQHPELIAEFLNELNVFGRIYMHRFRPDNEIIS